MSEPALGLVRSPAEVKARAREFHRHAEPNAAFVVSEAEGRAVVYDLCDGDPLQQRDPEETFKRWRAGEERIYLFGHPMQLKRTDDLDKLCGFCGQRVGAHVIGGGKGRGCPTPPIPLDWPAIAKYDCEVQGHWQPPVTWIVRRLTFRQATLTTRLHGPFNGAIGAATARSVANMLNAHTLGPDIENILLEKERAYIEAGRSLPHRPALDDDEIPF